MIPQENYDAYHRDDSTYHMGEESIQSATMQYADPGVNQHYDDERSAPSAY